MLNLGFKPEWISSTTKNLISYAKSTLLGDYDLTRAVTFYASLGVFV
jgi:hypothetical protein